MVHGSKGFSYKNESIFTCPPSLEKNMKFWKDIFAKYYSYEVVLHDRDNLDIIYEVIDFQKEFKGKKYHPGKHR